MDSGVTQSTVGLWRAITIFAALIFAAGMFFFAGETSA